MDKNKVLEIVKKMCDTIMAEHTPVISQKWAYEAGLTLKGFEAIYKLTGEKKYFDYIKASMDYFVTDDGEIQYYDMQKYNIDFINNGKCLLYLYAETGEEKYRKAIETLETQLKGQPRTASGAYFHKKIYPAQIWLDGLFMAEPFCAQYARDFNHPENFDDIANQFKIAAASTYDERTGLYVHACDESHEAFWADKLTGKSKNVWGRSCGWMAMALGDVLDFMPEDHPRRGELIELLKGLLERVSEYQDPEAGVWYQVLDSRRKGNYLEASCSCMFTCALAKAIRKGYISEDYKSVLEKAIDGVFKEFVTYDDTRADLNKICYVAGLGPDDNPKRDGTFEYYMSEPIVSNDNKGNGAFILMCAQYLM